MWSTLARLEVGRVPETRHGNGNFGKAPLHGALTRYHKRRSRYDKMHGRSRLRHGLLQRVHVSYDAWYDSILVLSTLTSRSLDTFLFAG